MQYKTIVLELLIQRPRLHVRLKQQHLLISTLEQYAKNLKTSHEAWETQLSQAKPGSDPAQIASEALEIAIQELENGLPCGSEQDDEPVSLDAAMTFLRRHTPPA
jgi:hypothetical protein